MKLPLGGLGDQRQESQELHGRIPQLNQLQRGGEQRAGRPGVGRPAFRDGYLAVSGRRKKPTSFAPEAGKSTAWIAQEQAVQQRDGFLQMGRRERLNYLPPPKKKDK